MHKIDALGIFFLGGLLGLLTAAVYATLHFGWFKSWQELAGCLVVGAAFVAIGLGAQGLQAPKNSKVHGAARPASEQEAQAAARGETKAARLHDQQFPE